MTINNLLNTLNDNVNVSVINSLDEIIAAYDGKNSIDLCLNECLISKIEIVSKNQINVFI